MSVSGSSNAQRLKSPTESQGTAGTTIQTHETNTTSNHSSSEVSETKFLYSQAERLLVYAMEIWFKDNDIPGRHIMETALKQIRTATGTTATNKYAPEPDFARSKPYPSVELIDSILTLVSLELLEAQWLALRNGQVGGPLRNHYMVSVNYAAWCFIGIKMAETAGGDIHKHLKSSKRFYEQNIIYGLQHMSVADLPTTALFQALLSGFRCVCEADPFWLGEAAVTSYAASAIMTSVLQLNVSASRNSLEQNELLAHARDSLRYLLSALSYLSTESDGYAIKLSISW
ncbi:hypothetical protein CGCSCA4_v007841 [Colletotrichum siamense]|uniref:Uncharacterized protein n=1 Tax=Colletotrichum siamense TaxID=690259 RepID=A0A9P5K9J6_COLSI|nr:hypothetical protein CGCSCA4_v007841 [Colletotrichum siamense]KAF4863508.1 hypothetical protein CGCSCA2_v002719 [Colletotrichum siamense]